MLRTSPTLLGLQGGLRNGLVLQSRKRRPWMQRSPNPTFRFQLCFAATFFRIPLQGKRDKAVVSKTSSKTSSSWHEGARRLQPTSSTVTAKINKIRPRYQGSPASDSICGCGDLHLSNISLRWKSQPCNNCRRTPPVHTVNTLKSTACGRSVSTDVRALESRAVKIGSSNCKGHSRAWKQEFWKNVDVMRHGNPPRHFSSRSVQYECIFSECSGCFECRLTARLLFQFESRRHAASATIQVRAGYYPQWCSFLH